MVQTEGRVAVAVEPEVASEALAHVVGAGPPRDLAVEVAGLASEVRPGDERGVVQRLGLGEGDRRLAHPAVGGANARLAVAPALVAAAAVVRSLIPHPPVAVGGATVEPGQGSVDVRQQALDRLGRQPPPPHLAEQHHEQRRRVDGPVGGRTAAEGHATRDAARLFFCARVVLGALQPRQRLENADGEVGVDEQRRPRGEHRVAGVERHRPRNAGGDDGTLGDVGVEDAQRAEVVGAARHRRCQAGVVGADLRQPAPPARQPLRGPLVGRAASEVRFEVGAVDLRRHLDGQPPRPTRGDDGLERQPARFDRRRLPPAARIDMNAHTAVAASLGEDEVVSVDIGSRIGRADAALPHCPHRGEVGLDEEIDVDVGSLLGEVAHDDLVVQAVTDLAATLHDEAVAAAADEGGAVGVVGPEGERLGGGAVDQEREP